MGIAIVVPFRHALEVIKHHTALIASRGQA